MSYCFGEGCPHPDHIGESRVAKPVVSRTCNAKLDYKTDGKGQAVILECNRLRDHRGAHRGKYGDEVYRW